MTETASGQSSDDVTVGPDEEKIMKMYHLYGGTMYGGGIAVVAANNQKQARKTLLEGDV